VKLAREGPGHGAASSPSTDEEALASRERWARCAACRERVAPESARIDVAGAHEHAFVNPSGLRFVVVCFATAPGAVPEGERSTVWTWFPGYAWQISLCRACRAHVGWSFHAPSGAAFWGLVRDRLIRDDADD
jgi:hypothetical protein